MVNNVWDEIARLIKHNAIGAVESTQPMHFVFGTVISANPLQIQIDQKMVLPDQFLILTNAVKDHKVDIEVSWHTDDNKHKHGNGNDGQDTTEVEHKHTVKGRKEIIVYNGLTVGEKVLLLRAQGGQHYIVLDRVDEIPTTGESV